MFRRVRSILDDFRVAAAVGKRDHRTVISLAEEAHKRDPRQVVWLVLIARAQQSIGEKESAAGTWRRVLALEPDNFDALTELTAHYLKKHQPAVACEAVRRALQTQDKSHDLTAFERFFLRVAGRLSGKNIERSAHASVARRRQWEKRWREWAERFLATHGDSSSSDEPVN